MKGPQHWGAGIFTSEFGFISLHYISLFVVYEFVFVFLLHPLIQTLNESSLFVSAGGSDSFKSSLLLGNTN